MEYDDFVAAKQFVHVESGFTPSDLPDTLFGFQRDIVNWACRRGRAAIFADTGLGKTLMEMTWAQQVAEHTGGRVLMVAPLCVARQHVREGEKFGTTIQYVREQSQIESDIVVTNYEMLDKFDVSSFDGIVLDESSILKSSDGKTRTRIIESCKSVPYRLGCTATPSPNDHMELGNQAEFLSIMTQTEMLAMFFTHDSGDTQKWRLKGHGKSKFWEWMATWSVCIRKPSDLGYSNDGYDLPGLDINQHVVKSHEPREGELFVTEALTLSEQRTAQRESTADRAAKVAEIVNHSDEQFIVWCNTNAESDLLKKAIDGAVEVKGSDTADHKEKAIESFINYGKQCFCDKLAETESETESCQKKPTSKNTTRKTETGEKPSQSNTSGETGRSGESTCESTQRETATSSDEHLSSKQSTTSAEKSGTPTASMIAQRPEKQLQTGNKEIQKRGLPKGSENTESPLTNTMQCSTSKADVVQSAEAVTPKTEEQSACSSITATKQPGSEDCFARPAISESENLRTSQNCSCQQQNTSKARVLISKPSIFGFGLNLQHCHNMAFVGLSNSFEQYYQAVRRCYRFGQKHRVNVHIVTAEAEGAVKANIQRKQNQSDEMSESMVSHMRTMMQKNISGAIMETSPYVEDTASGNGWELHLGDCVKVCSRFDDDSIDYTVFSPPFASLFTYSNSDFDMGNCKGEDDFLQQFRYLVDEMYRTTKPGRLLSFHCMNMPTSKANDGYIGMRDFRGNLIRAFQDAGWIYHSEVCIWKDPVVAMQRTKALGLLHKTIRKDSAMSRQGIPDYLVTMRKPGVNPNPIRHYRDESEMEEVCEAEGLDKEQESRNIFPVELWQKIASPIWMDIKQGRTLQYRSARENDDERHICPLQLDVIERALMLWSREDDLVFSPFAGIGSEGYCAVQMGRRFIGSELKPSYWELACKNLTESEKTQDDLFSAAL